MPTIDYPGDLYFALNSLVQNHTGLCIWGWRFILLFSVLFFVCSTILKSRVVAIEKNNKFRNLITSKWLFITVACVGMLLLRLPNLLYPILDNDEGQWIANAGTYYEGAVMWKSVSGYTSGPLIFIPLNIMVWAGGLNFATVRLFGILICIIPSLWLIWKTIINFYDELTARIAIIPLFIFFAALTNYALLAYNSEHVPMLLISLSLYFLSICYKNNFSTWIYIAAVGFFLGLVPYAKLQAAPLALTIGIYILLFIPGKTLFSLSKFKQAIVLIAAALLPSIIVAVYLTAHNCWPDFLNGYIAQNLFYQQTGLIGFSAPYTGIEKYMLIFQFIKSDFELLLMVITLITPPIILFAFTDKKIAFTSKGIFPIVVLFASYLCVVAPGNGFRHYIILFIIPFVLFSAGIIYYIIHHLQSTAYRKAFLYLALLPVFISPVYHARKDIKPINYALSNPDYRISEVSKYLKSISKPGDKISVWGWNYNYYVEAGLTQGNTYSHSFYSMISPWQNNAALKQFISEININKPLVFIDDVSKHSFLFRDPKYKHENYPPLHNFILTHYTQVYSNEGTRVYILNERLQKFR